jgi:serine/threonine-protein kinase
MTARWNAEVPHHSVLESLRASLGEVPRVLLRDTKDEPEPPVVRPASPERPDDTGRYQILGEIDHGGMGAVFKGRDPDLGRDLAIKVLLKKWHDDPDVGRRFVEEAQIGGQLQHPGIAPVYELGSFEDGRPYFTMRLLKGRTLAELLAEREAPPAGDLPRFLSIFEAICQTVAYAHARGVIHRDLKPSNIMVGSYGEVQVIDWGLAKVLPQGGVADESSDGGDDAALSVIRTVRTGPDAVGSRTGRLGTPAYMPPEQASGDVEAIDERADVFGLGSILCEVLTGKPVYTGPTGKAILNAAIRGDTADALRRLDGCGADAELIGLARACLMVDPHERPRDAGEIVRRLNAYLAGVQERLRAAELARAAEAARAEEAERTAEAAELARAAEEARAEEEARGRVLADRLAREAEARARSERHRLRMTVGLAASILALAGLEGGTWLFAEQSKAQRRAAVVLALDEARRLHAAARDAEVDDPARWGEALAALERAEGLLAQGGDPQQKRAADALKASLEADRQVARKEAEWRERLVEIRVNKASSTEGSGAEAGYVGLFREAGIDPDTLGAEVAAGRIRSLKQTLAERLVAALDDWASVRRTQRNDPVAARRLLAVARLADPDRWRGLLRSALDQPGGQDRLKSLRELAGAAQVEELPAVSLDLLGVSLLDEGDAAAAADLLRKAQRIHAKDGWLKYTLARALHKLGKTQEAIRYFMAARTIHPETAHDLAHLLEDNGETDEAIAVFRDLSRLRPKDPRNLYCLGRALKSQGRKQEADPALDAAIVLYREQILRNPQDGYAHRMAGQALEAKGDFGEAIFQYQTVILLNPKDAGIHQSLGRALQAQGKPEDAVAEYRVAMRLNPNDLWPHNSLGNALMKQEKLEEAVAEYREAIRLKPDEYWPHYNLGLALRKQGKPTEAMTSFREAIGLKPDEYAPHNNLGDALSDQGKLDEAIAEYRTALRLKPDDPDAHCNLALTLEDRGRVEDANASYLKAIAMYREAIRLNPDKADAHSGLGLALSGLGKRDEAIAEYRTALRLKPDFATAHNNLGGALRDQGKLAEAIAECRTALRLNPDDTKAHYNLGNALSDEGKRDEAIAEYRTALRLKPDFADAHLNLGLALKAQGEHSEAIGEFRTATRQYRTAIRLKPDFATAHLNLGKALKAQGEHSEAIDEFRTATRLKPDYVEVHRDLAAALVAQGGG